MKKFLITILSLFLITHSAYAATLSTNAPKDINVGDRISIDILVDPQKENINSVEINLNFPKDILKFDGYNNSQSSVPIWIVEPKETSPGLINFSGIIPGGVERSYDPQNSKNQLVRLTSLSFIAKSVGEGSINFGATQLLKNDGKGTSIQTSYNSGYIVIKNTTGQTNKELIISKEKEDTNPPLPFTVSVIDKSLFGKTPKLAVFNAVDQESGIEHYEVSIGSENFKVANSPFPLPYKLFSYTLTARAYDFSGNYKEQQVVVPGENSYGIFFAAMFSLVAVVFYRYIMRTLRKKNHEIPKTDL